MILILALAVAAQQQPAWKVAAQPKVRIGEIEAEEPYMFAQVSGAVRLSDGRIVVANGGSNELRVYTAEGRHIATHGRTGGGPGEFQALRALWFFPGDTVMAMDTRIGRLSVYDASMKLVRAEQIRPIPGAVGRLANGSYLATQGLAPPEKRTDFRGLIEFEGLVLRLPPGGTVYDTIVRGVKAGQSFVQPVGNSWRQYPFPYGRSAQIGIGRTRFYYGDTHSTEIGIYDVNGQPIGKVKVRGSGRELTPVHIQKWVDFEVDKRTTEEAKTNARSDFKQIPANKRSPEFAALKVDDAGNLWVRRYGPPWDPSPDWDIYTADGRPLGNVRLPVRFEPMHIGREFVLGVTRGELDVERVELYTLTR